MSKKKSILERFNDNLLVTIALIVALGYLSWKHWFSLLYFSGFILLLCTLILKVWSRVSEEEIDDGPRVDVTTRRWLSLALRPASPGVMLNNLRCFFRRMNEPVWGSPRLKFWSEGFQKRARLTGKLPEGDVMKQMGLPENNSYWKEDNFDPENGFAVNVNVDLAHLKTLESEAERGSYIQGRDDFGRKVKRIPISRTGSQTWFDFCSSAPECPYDGKDVTLEKFVSDVSRALRDEMIPQRESWEYLHLDDADEVTWTRIAWNGNAWYFQCDFKEND